MSDGVRYKYRYNKYIGSVIEIGEGEEFCEKCRGEGTVIPKRGTGMFNKGNALCCDKCGGSGKVDWIQKATGKERVTRQRYASEHTS